MYFTPEKSRDSYKSAAERLTEVFGDSVVGCFDAEYLSADRENAAVAGVCGLPAAYPVTSCVINAPAVSEYLTHVGSSVLFVLDTVSHSVSVICDGAAAPALPVDAEAEVLDVIAGFAAAPGRLNERGEHIIDLKSPEVGTHYRINLLLGCRIGFDNPLLTTPKSAVNALGGGSFRADAGRQVLVTRCLLQQEENGDPMNRQFYLVENGRQIFFSGNPRENVKSAVCCHSQNHTVITYETECGLRIERTIFILPERAGQPEACEVQKITVQNLGSTVRNLKIVMTGVFGIFPPEALANDIVYCNIVHESGVLKRDGKAWVVTPMDYPRGRRFEKRFAAMTLDGEPMDEYSASYPDFIGDGTVEHPQNVARLTSHPVRKAAYFFAMGKSFTVMPGDTKEICELVGMCWVKEDDSEPLMFDEKLSSLLSEFTRPGACDRALREVTDFYSKYSSYIKLDSKNPLMDPYINNNLPFQVLYQSFVSRSFAWTQKAQRQIGFREIQDMYASMYYMAAMGRADLARDMISRWAENVFRMGYANHNFYWEGKEPGKCSDDQLWLVQAVYRYVALTGDTDFLDAMLPVADGGERSLFDTIMAAIVYSGEISVGDHGLPLLDNADWNDCLKLDPDSIDGIEKEKRYKAQLERNGQEWGVRFESHFCESVMNAFLLKIAEDEACRMARATGRNDAAEKLDTMSAELSRRIQTHCWKENFFARAMINSPRDGGYTFVGAKGDRLSADPAIDGSYFLNSFTWSILAGVATEEQIATMLGVVKAHLRCPAGLKLSTPCDLDKISTTTATEHYFPGDRENGAVFKHATMMATAAMFRAAKTVKSDALAAELSDLAFWMLDLVFPYRTLNDPFTFKGNPRFCTQYNNSETMENVGPMLSGTASWLSLTVSEFLGIDYTDGGIELSPILPDDSENVDLELNRLGTRFLIHVEKSKDFARVGEGTRFTFDGEACGRIVPAPMDGGVHRITVAL